MVDFYKVKCTRVIDGDTFCGDVSLRAFNMTFHDQHFRLMGVNTPERKQAGYFEATEFTAQHLEGKELTVFIYGKDSFGRWLSDVYVDDTGSKFNDLLLKEGLAEIFKR